MAGILAPPLGPASFSMGFFPRQVLPTCASMTIGRQHQACLPGQQPQRVEHHLPTSPGTNLRACSHWFTPGHMAIHDLISGAREYSAGSDWPGLGHMPIP